MIFDVVESQLNSSDFLGFFIGDFGFEFFFQSHYQLDGVKRIGSQILDERSRDLYVFFFHTQLLCDDFLDAFFDAAHGSYGLLKFKKLDTGQAHGAITAAESADRSGRRGGEGRHFTGFSREENTGALQITGVKPQFISKTTDYDIYMPPFTCSVSPVM